MSTQAQNVADEPRRINGIEFDVVGGKPLFGISFDLGEMAHVVWFDDDDMRELVDLLRRVDANGTADHIVETMNMFDESVADSRREINATLVRKLDDFRGDARLYRLSEPVPIGYEPWDDSQDREVSDHVIVSAAGGETFIFGADADGKILNWGEMPGSFRGAHDHEQAIKGAGWVLS